MSGLPSMEEVAAKFAPQPEVAPAPSAAGEVVNPAEGKGGTTTDPTLSAPAPEIKEEAAVPVGKEEGAEEPKEEPVKKDPLSAKFGALARKEREMRAREADFNRKMADFEAKFKDFESRQAAESSKPKAKSPLELLQQHGFTYNQATEQLLGGWKAPEVDPLEERLRPVQERLSAMDQLAKQVEDLKAQLSAKEQAQAYDQAMTAISDAISQGGDRYEYIQKLGDQAVDLVRDTIVEYYNTHQKMLDYSEACDIVEAWYEENVVKPVLTTKKVQSRLPKETPQVKTPPKEAKAPTTLTNSLANSGGEATIDLDKLPKEEALALLAKRIKFIET